MSPVPIDVDTGSYLSAASELYDANHGIIDAVSTLNSALGSGSGMAGTDTGGEAWAAQYDKAAQPLVQAGCDLGEAMGQSANLLNASLKNHDGADFGARLDTPAQYQTSASDGDPDPDHWTETLSPAQLPSSAGGVGGEPGWWHWIAGHLEGLFWPDADTGKLRTVGQAWISAGDSVDVWVSVVDSARLEIQFEKSPEIPDAVSALAELSQHTADLADAYHQIGAACNDYAKHVDDHHDMIKDELVSFIEWTAGIEIVGGIISVFTLGAAEAPTQAVEAAEVANAASKVVRILKALVELARTVAETIGSILTKVTTILGDLKKFLNAKAIAALEKVGVAVGRSRGLDKTALDAAYTMNKGGGHAIRHLIDEGLIENRGSLAAKVARFCELTQPILENPSKTFPYVVGGTKTTGYAGVIDGHTVVVFVAESGPKAGTIVSSIIPDANQLVTMGLK